MVLASFCLLQVEAERGGSETRQFYLFLSFTYEHFSGCYAELKFLVSNAVCRIFSCIDLRLNNKGLVNVAFRLCRYGKGQL